MLLCMYVDDDDDDAGVSFHTSYHTISPFGMLYVYRALTLMLTLALCVHMRVCVCISLSLSLCRVCVCETSACAPCVACAVCGGVRCAPVRLVPLSAVRRPRVMRRFRVMHAHRST
jgi:hypothetical protein